MLPAAQFYRLDWRERPRPQLENRRNLWFEKARGYAGIGFLLRGDRGAHVQGDPEWASRSPAGITMSCRAFLRNAIIGFEITRLRREFVRSTNDKRKNETNCVLIVGNKQQCSQKPVWTSAILHELDDRDELASGMVLNSAYQ